MITNITTPIEIFEQNIKSRKNNKGQPTREVLRLHLLFLKHKQFYTFTQNDPGFQTVNNYLITGFQ